MGILVVADAIVEFSDMPRADQFAETAETAPFFRNGDGKYRFTIFTDIGAFGHETQAVEIQVGAGCDGDQCLSGQRRSCFFKFSDLSLDTGDSQCAGRFQNAACVQENVFDGGADIVGIDQNDIINIFAGYSEGFFADQFDCCTIGNQADILQIDASACIKALFHGAGVGGFDTDYADFRTDLFDIGGNAGDQASAADRYEDGMDRSGMLTENFHADRALSCNDIGIVERMDEGQMSFFFQFLGVVAGIGERIAIQYDFDIVAAMCADGLYLDGRGGGRHGDDGPAVKSSGGQCDALGMVACRSADHAFFQLVGRKICHFVICATQFETEYALHVLALEQDMVAGTSGEIGCLFERGFDGDIVNTCRKDFFQIIGHDDTGQRL